MSISYGFFNSVGGDRKYDADDISNFFLKLINSGVLSEPSGALQVTAGDGLTVNIAAGWAFINAKYFNSTGLVNLALSAAEATLDRIDRVCLRLDTNARKIEFAIKKGEPSGTPAAPTLQRTSSVYELSLATITVSAGAVSLSAADITDDRPDSALCGFVTGFNDLGGLSFARCTQAEYDAMETHDPNRVYIIVG